VADADGCDRPEITTRDDALDQQWTAVGRRAIIAARLGADGGICGGDHQRGSGDIRLADGVAGMDRPSPVNGFWRASDWLYCRDDKWRPVEPGTFPLAHGVPNRVGRLRGYGNAICVPQAVAFIEAVLDA
jgi:DNA (cytosine-5)-methyltransferase 1